MLDITKRIALVEQLLSSNTIESITYAALEARLTIEHLFYERLISSQPYYSKSDLTTWTAAQVVRQIAREANELIDQGLAIYISKFPNDPAKPPVTEEDFEALEWVKLGDQAALKVRKLNELHNALSKHALHVDMRRADKVVETYGDIEVIRKKVNQALDQFKQLQHGTLLAGSLSGEYSFDCVACKSKIRRKAELLQSDQIISCFNEKCVESYRAHIEPGQISHSRRVLDVHCTRCNRSIEVPAKKVEKLDFAETFTLQCACGADITVGLVPQSWQAKSPPSE